MGRVEEIHRSWKYERGMVSSAIQNGKVEDKDFPYAAAMRIRRRRG